MANRRSFRDVYHTEITTFLHSYHAWTRVNMTGQFSQTEPGGADIMVHLNGAGLAVEVKTASHNSFSFANWRDNQRQWAIDYQEQTHCIYWLAIVFENIPLKVKGLRVPRSCILIPANDMMIIENKVPQASIPYLSLKGIIGEQELDARHLMSNYELDWNKGWKVPQHHLFYRLYLENLNA